jgi:hypothetical protein
MPKTCGRNCTDHGTCLFVNSITGRILDECRLHDPSCEGVCACERQYSGRFCEISSLALQSRREVRSILIDRLGNITEQEDISAQAVASWSASLYSLSLHPHDLSANDVRKVAAIANTTLQQAMAVGVTSYADMAGVLQATDAVASLLRYNYNPNDYSDESFNETRQFVNNTAAGLLPVLRSFGDLMSGAMVVGENRTELRYENFQLSTGVHVLEAGTAGSITAVAPESDSQVGQPSSVEIRGNAEAATLRTVVVKLVTLYPRMFAVDTAAYTSTPISLQLRTVEGGADETLLPETYLSELEFTMVHNEEQIRYLALEQNFTTVCRTRNSTQKESFACPGTNYIIHHNCSRGAGAQTSHCPRPRPSCARVDPSSASITLPESCRVLRFTSRETVCSCVVRSPASARQPASYLRANRQLSVRDTQSVLDETGATDIMVTTVFIASDFADTFEAADDFTSPADATRVLVIIIMLSVLWLPGLLVGIEWFLPQSKGGKREGKEKDQQAMQSAKESVTRYIDRVIPAVFLCQDEHMMSRVWAEMLQHHILFRLFSSKRKRRETICRSLSVFTFMLFLTAVFFDVSSPGNDGSCASHESRDACLHRTSPFDSAQTYCLWTTGSDGTSKCEFHEKSVSLRALFYLTVITTVLTSIASVPLDYLFSIVSSPTARNLQESTVKSSLAAMVSGARRLSVAGRRLSASVLPVFTPPSAPTALHDRRSFRDRVRIAVLGDGDTVIANRDLPEEISEVAAQARKSTLVIANNAHSLLQEADASATSLRQQSMRLRGRPTSTKLTMGLGPKEDASRLAQEVVDDSEASLALAPGVVLLDEVLLQRVAIADDTEEAKIFDERWGVQREPADGADQSYVIPPGTSAAITADAAEVALEAALLIQAIPQYSLHHAGLEILHHFMVDLLGRNTASAKIFREKFSEDFAPSRVVSVFQKCLSAAALVGLNAFFAYYILLKGLQKGQEWQLKYLLCSILQITVDVLVFESTECVWLNYSVPRMVNGEVWEAIGKIRSLLEVITAVPGDLTTKRSAGAGTQKFFLNAPAHLFVSVRIARAHPQLLESLIVGSYHDHLPGAIWTTWPHHSSESQRGDAHSEAKQRHAEQPWSYSQAGALALALFVQQFAATPYVYQRVVIRFVQPMLVSAISVAWLFIARNTAATAVLAALFGAGLLYAIGRQLRARNKASVLPASTVADSSNAGSSVCLLQTQPMSPTIEQPLPADIELQNGAIGSAPGASRGSSARSLPASHLSSAGSAGLSVGTSSIHSGNGSGGADHFPTESSHSVDFALATLDKLFEPVSEASSSIHKEPTDHERARAAGRPSSEGDSKHRSEDGNQGGDQEDDQDSQEVGSADDGEDWIDEEDSWGDDEFEHFLDLGSDASEASAEEEKSLDDGDADGGDADELDSAADFAVEGSGDETEESQSAL